MSSRSPAHSPTTNNRSPLQSPATSVANLKRSDGVAAGAARRPSNATTPPVLIDEKTAEAIRVIRAKSIPEIETVLHNISTHQKSLVRILKEADKAEERRIEKDIEAISTILARFNMPFKREDLEMALYKIAKKVLEIKAVIEKAESVKRATILAQIISTILKYFSTHELPKELPQLPSEIGNFLLQKHSETSVLVLQKDDVYKTGELNKMGRKMKSLSKRYVTLTHSQLQIARSNKPDAPKKTIALADITSIYPLATTHKDGSTSYTFSITYGSKKMTFSAKTDLDLADWVLAIDGLERVHFTTAIAPYSGTPENEKDARFCSKESLLQMLYRTPFNGGTLKSSFEEEWTYMDGKLTHNEWGDLLQYTWDGTSLTPTPECKMSLGEGKWNGVWLAWYGEEQTDPFMRYIWQPLQNRYTVSHGLPELGWLRSRHFMVAAAGGAEWICEGEIPYPAIMLLQMMRYYRVGR